MPVAEPAAEPVEAVYDQIAPHYDAFTAHHDYDRWTAALLRLAEAHGLSGRRLLDVACGTGKSFAPLLHRGWTVTACDISPGMLERARERAGGSARVERADMRALPELGRFDLVWCLDDGINYLLEPAELVAAFAGMARSLAAGGLLLFDLNTLGSYRTFFAETHVQEGEDEVLIWRGEAGPAVEEGDVVSASFDAFEHAGDGTWRRTTARHRQRHHPVPEVRAALDAAGLECLTVHGQGYDARFEQPPDQLRHTKFVLIARARNGSPGKEVRSDASREARQAGRAVPVHPEGRLTEREGRAAPPAARPSPSYSSPVALKRSVEVFEASDGAIYLLRGGGDAEFVVREPTRLDRAVLGLLTRGETTREELLGRLRARGLTVDGDAVAAELAGLEEAGLLAPLPDGASPGAQPDLTPEELERFDRQLVYLADLAPRTPAPVLQARLRAATVVILGCGGLGSWTACGLACAGVGTLVLVDDDTVALSNLNRQLLFREADVGRPKVDVAAEALTAFNPRIEVRPVARRVRGAADVGELVAGSSLAIGTADWPPYEIGRWINEACVAAGVPFLTAGQSPPTIRVGPLHVPGETACLACQESATRRDFPLYDELVAFRRTHDSTAATLGPASGTIGSILAMEAVHHLTGAVTPATRGAGLVFDLRTLAARLEPVERDPECPVCGPGQPPPLGV